MVNSKIVKGIEMKFFEGVEVFKEGARGWVLEEKNESPIYKHHKFFLHIDEKGKINNKKGPAMIEVMNDESYTKIEISFFEDEKYHKIDGPAKIFLKGIFDIDDIPDSVLDERTIEDFVKWGLSQENSHVEYAYFLDGRNYHPKDYKREIIGLKLKAL